MHRQCADTASSCKMFTIMCSRPIILLICLAITAAIAHPYGHQQLLPQQDAGYPQPNEYGGIDQRPITYRKHFHFFAAPEEEDTFDDNIPEELLKKDINVVVIKAPENNKATAAIARLAKTLAEEKTAIYVLNKEPDLKEISSHIERLKDQKTIRPEVHFIKYKTAEEADLAARNIQVEYDALRGPSEVEHQLTAALHSYVGLLDDGAVQEMQLVSFYGRPRIDSHSLLKSSSGDASKGEPLLSSGIYLPPDDKLKNTSVFTSGEGNSASGSEDVANAGASPVSSSFYLPPSEETSSAINVRSDYGKRSASTNVKSLNLKTETATEQLEAEKIPSAATSTESSSSTDKVTEKLATSTESILPTASVTKRSRTPTTSTESTPSTASVTKKSRTPTTSTERTAYNAKSGGKKKSSRGRLRYSHSEANKPDQQQ